MVENRNTVSEASIFIYRSARKHFITEDEIRMTVAYPRLVYSLTSRLTESTVVHRYIGGREGGPWIEVLAEQSPEGIHVFHAMLLTGAVALEAEAASGRSIRFVEDLVSQRSGFPRTHKNEE